MGINTDLALEAYASDKAESIEGTRVSERFDSRARLKITEIDILTDTAAERLGKPAGKYITLESEEDFSEYCPCLTERRRAVSEAIEKICGKGGMTLFAGLGNRRITPDSLGPLAADRIFATAHIKRLAKELDSSQLGECAAVAAGVMAQTGIESAELIKALCDKIKPSRVIVCDALACSEPSHMGHTIQISGSGISPGSGVENSRAELSQRTLGVPVTAVGVPTVSRLMCDDERFGGLMITPRTVDKLVLFAAELISGGVNMFLHPSLTEEEIASLVL